MTANEILTVARSQIGVKESPAGSNNVKYNTEYYGRAVSGSPYPWCMVFVWWVFKHADAASLFYDGNKCAGCTTFMRWAKNTNRFVTSNYKPGDVLLFDFDGDKNESEHTGICESASGSTVVSIEGNTSLTSNDNGGAVMRRTRSKKLIIGAYRPAYSDASGIDTIGEEKCKVELRVLSRGKTGDDVKALQILLVGNGYNPNGIDGIFGAGCEKAVKKYQTDKKLEVDGYVGPATWGSLLGV